MDSSIKIGRVLDADVYPLMIEIRRFYSFSFLGVLFLSRLLVICDTVLCLLVYSYLIYMEAGRDSTWIIAACSYAFPICVLDFMDNLRIMFLACF